MNGFMGNLFFLLSAKTPKNINIPPEVLLIGASGGIFVHRRVLADSNNTQSTKGD